MDLFFSFYLSVSSALPEKMTSQVFKTHFQAVGGDGGESFRHSNFPDTKFVHKIEVWADTGKRSGITAIKLIYHGGSESPIFGSVEDASCKALELNPGETISSVTMGTMDGGQRVGYLSILTTRGHRFEQGSADSDAMEEIRGHGGLIMGIEGRCGDVINKLGFHFLDSPMSVDVDIEYLLDWTIHPHVPVTFKSYDLDNRTGGEDLEMQIDDEIAERCMFSTEDPHLEPPVTINHPDAAINSTSCLVRLEAVRSEYALAVSHKKHTSNPTQPLHETMRWKCRAVVPRHQKCRIDLTYKKCVFEIAYRAFVTFHWTQQQPHGERLRVEHAGRASGVAIGVAEFLVRDEELAVSHAHLAALINARVKVLQDVEVDAEVEGEVEVEGDDEDKDCSRTALYILAPRENLPVSMRYTPYAVHRAGQEPSLRPIRRRIASGRDVSSGSDEI